LPISKARPKNRSPLADVENAGVSAAWPLYFWQPRSINRAGSEDRRFRGPRFFSTAINRCRSTSGPFWQPRFFVRALRTVKEYNEKVEYIHLNPVKAGLVRRPEEWFWSSAREYSGSLHEEATRHPFLPIDRVLLPSDEQKRI